MAQIIITPADNILRRFGNQIAALGAGQAHKALARALNRVTTTVHGRVIKAVHRQSDIPASIVRKSIKRKLSSVRGGALVGEVTATGKPLSLKHFRARQISSGSKAKFHGRWHQYQSAFMGPRPGTIAAKLGGNIFVRTSDKRFPIEMLFGPSVPEELVHRESESVFYDTVGFMLPERVGHELGRLLP